MIIHAILTFLSVIALIERDAGSCTLERISVVPLHARQGGKEQ